jgi:hypothetical protein
MKTNAFHSLVGGAGMLVLAGSAEAAAVGSGTPESCTEATFTAAFAAGGLVTFNCGPNPHIIIVTSQKTVLTGMTTLRGAGLITISGGNATRLFVVPAGATLVAEDIVLRNGRASELTERGAMGGAVLVDGGALSLLRSTIRDSGTAQGMVQRGGAIASVNGTVTLTASLLDGNDSDSGGGVHSSGPDPSLTLVDTVVRNNRARGEDGDGGGIAVRNGVVSIKGGRLEGNTAEHGGGLSVSMATVDVTDTIITRNTATLHRGGGVLNEAGTLTLTDVILSENKNGFPPLQGEVGEPVPPLAAGLYNTASGVATLVGVTLRENDGLERGAGTASLVTLGKLTLHSSTVRAPRNTLGVWIAGEGSATVTDTLLTGGAANVFACPGTLTANRVAFSGAGSFNLFLGGNASLVNSTINGAISSDIDDNALVSVFVGSALSEDTTMSCGEAGTVSFLNSTIASDQGRGQIFVRGKDYKVTLKNTIVSSPGLLCFTEDDGQIVSEGFNIASDNSCGLKGPGDKPDTDPKLGPLRYNGGPTPTRAPLAASLAVDNGTTVGCPAIDQRGVSRPRGASCDMGAFELGALVAAVGLNETSFTEGDDITYEGTVNPGLTPTLVDIYLGALLPDLVTFLSFVEPAPGVLAVTVGSKPVPYRTNTTAAPLAIRFEYTFNGSELLGVYRTYAALIAAGKDPLNAVNQLSLDIQTFELVPPPEPDGEPQ